MSSSHQPPSDASAPKLLSCSSCRLRKVKCDKVYPCSPCARGGLECVFPSRKRNRTPRRTKQTDLLDRLARLEHIVGKVDPEALNKLDAPRSGASVQHPPSDSAQGPASVGTAHHVPGAGSTSPPAAAGRGPAFTFMPGSTHSAMLSAITVSADRTEPATSQIATEQSPDDTDRRGSAPGAFDDPTRKYLGQEFWTNLCESVEGLRVALQTSSDSDEEDDETLDAGVVRHASESTGYSGSDQSRNTQGLSRGSSSSQLTTSHLLLGDSVVTIPTADALAHPPPDQILYLLSNYFTNVDPLLKILHRPTISTQITTFLTSGLPRASSPGLDALFFAIYFAAATSLSATPNPSDMGKNQPPNIDRTALVTRFRLATELALARANYLTCTDSLLPLQAFTIYVAVLRCHSGSQASWALLSLAVRLAHALGLHHDGDDAAAAAPSTAHSPTNNPSPSSSSSSSGPSFYEAELRRRLWWQLVVLDVRAIEDRGAAGLIPPDSFNTAIPTNISDNDFGPSTTVSEAAAATADDDVATDATFFLCSCMCSRGNLLVGTPVLSTTGRRDERPKVETVRDVVQGLERRFGNIRGGEGVMVSVLAAEVSRIVILKLWLVVRFPIHIQGQELFPSEQGQTPAQACQAVRVPALCESLRTATYILEIAALSLDRAAASRYGWYTATYVQWHPLAVALANLCAQPTGPLADRAWAVVTRIYPRSGEWIADSKRGALWRPIRKLFKKAREAREKGLKQDTEGRDKAGDGEIAQETDTAITSATLGAGSNMMETSMWQSAQQLPLPPSTATTADSIGGITAAMTAEAYPAAMQFLDEFDFNTMDFDFSGEPMDWTNWNEFVNDAQGNGDNAAATWMLDVN